MFIKNFKYTINNNKLTLVTTGVPQSDQILDLLEYLTGPLHISSFINPAKVEVTHRDRKAVLNGLSQLSTILGPVNVSPLAVLPFVERFAKYMKITKTNMSRLERFILSFNNATLKNLKNRQNTRNKQEKRYEMEEMLRMLDPLIIFNKRINVTNLHSGDFVGPVFSGIARLSLLLSTPINIDMENIQSFTQQYIFYRIGQQQPKPKPNNQNQTTKQPKPNKRSISLSRSLSFPA